MQGELLHKFRELCRQRDLAHELLTAIPGVSCVKPKATLYMFPRLDPKMYPIANDQDFIAELLQKERARVRRLVEQLGSPAVEVVKW